VLRLDAKGAPRSGGGSNAAMRAEQFFCPLVAGQVEP
jgi:hypothetical protein